MIFVINTENRKIFESDLAEMHRQRKIVFVDRAGWKLPVFADQEVDCYDREDTIYLLAKEDPDGPLLASVRLLPTTRPHLMSDLFPAACRDGAPRGPAVWEVSRFCTTAELPGGGVRLGLLWEIICGVMETALLYGVHRVIFVANRALLPLALTCGWEAVKLGETLRDERDEVTPVAAVINPAGLDRVRHLHRVSIPVIRFHAGAPLRSPTDSSLALLSADSGHPLSALGWPGRRSTSIHPQPESSPIANGHLRIRMRHVPWTRSISPKPSLSSVRKNARRLAG